MEANAALRIIRALSNGMDPRTGAISEYAAGFSKPDQIALGADGNLWYTCEGGGLVGRITPLGIATTFATQAAASGDIVSESCRSTTPASVRERISKPESRNTSSIAWLSANVLAWKRVNP